MQSPREGMLLRPAWQGVSLSPSPQLPPWLSTRLGLAWAQEVGGGRALRPTYQQAQGPPSNSRGFVTLHREQRLPSPCLPHPSPLPAPACPILPHCQPLPAPSHPAPLPAPACPGRPLPRDSRCRTAASRVPRPPAWAAAWMSCKAQREGTRGDTGTSFRHRLGAQLGWGRVPDGHGRTLGQSLPSALQPCVDLPHLHCTLQPHHLQEVVAEICKRGI